MSEQKWEFQLNRLSPKHTVPLRDRSPIWSNGQQVGVTSEVKATFTNGVCITTSQEVANLLLQHPSFNASDPVFGFRLLSGDAAPAKAVAPTADTVSYDQFSRDALQKLCEERRVKSYGTKEELVSRLEDSDRKAKHAAGIYSDKEKAKILKKYDKAKLLELAKTMGVVAGEGDEPAVILEALIACGAELDI
jgi:hypothetical protein